MNESALVLGAKELHWGKDLVPRKGYYTWGRSFTIKKCYHNMAHTGIHLGSLKNSKCFARLPVQFLQGASSYLQAEIMRQQQAKVFGRGLLPNS